LIGEESCLISSESRHELARLLSMLWKLPVAFWFAYDPFI
jgi:hypothetical protein